MLYVLHLKGIAFLHDAFKPCDPARAFATNVLKEIANRCEYFSCSRWGPHYAQQLIDVCSCMAERYSLKPLNPIAFKVVST